MKMTLRWISSVGSGAILNCGVELINSSWLDVGCSFYYVLYGAYANDNKKKI